MLQKKWIDQSEHDKAVAASAEFDPGTRRTRPYPYLLAAIRQEFIDNVGERKLNAGGLKIQTSVDMQMQIAAEAAVRAGTQRLRRSHGWLQRKKPLQSALLSVDPGTGGIRALVGGSDFSRSQFDRTRKMKRQPGSAAKPFTYAAAIDSRTVTPSSIIEDTPVRIQLASNRSWAPKNYDGQFRGQVTVREAFEKSLNVPAVKVASQVGVDRVRGMLNNAGITGDLSETPAIALGVDEVTMRELVAAYTTFPNLGTRTDPYLIERVDTRQGGEVYAHEVKRSDVMDPAVAYVVHSLMRGVVMRGTAASLNQSGLGSVAGKTGTTSNYRDAWFVGYTPDLLTAVWVGFDDGTPLRMSSGEAAVPLWAAYMTKVPHSNGELQPPGGVSVVEVDVATGRLWQPQCGPNITEVFLSGTEPREPCGGGFDYGQILAGYQEPAMIMDSAMMDMPIDGAHEMQVVNDPDAVDISPEDTLVQEDSIPTYVPPAPRVQDTLSRPIQPPVQIPPRQRRTTPPPEQPRPEQPRPEPPKPEPPVVVPPVDSTPAPPPKDSLVLTSRR
jgi:membrane carboxypeptidase/penicillin-binding protein